MVAVVAPNVPFRNGQLDQVSDLQREREWKALLKGPKHLGTGPNNTHEDQGHHVFSKE